MCVWLQNTVEFMSTSTLLDTPVDSKTSISVHVPAPSFWWNQKLDEMLLDPDRDLTSK